MTVSPTLPKLARAHSGAMARRAAARYGGRCDGRALWHNATQFGASTWIAGRVIWVTVNFKQAPPG